MPETAPLGCYCLLPPAPLFSPDFADKPPPVPVFEEEDAAVACEAPPGWKPCFAARRGNCCSLFVICYCRFWLFAVELFRSEDSWTTLFPSEPP